MKNRKLLALVLSVCLMFSTIVATPTASADATTPQKKINVLLIGNTQTSDNVNYLAEIFDSAGYTDFNIVSLCYHGATLSKVYEEMLLSEIAETNNISDRTNGVYKYNVSLTTVHNNGISTVSDTTSRNVKNSFIYQKYSKTDGGEIKSHQAVYNYNLKNALLEDDWDIISLQNINNDYTKTDDAAYKVLSAGSDSVYGNYSTAFSFGGKTYYAGKEYIGKEYISILLDYIKTNCKNETKVYFNSTWVPEYKHWNDNNDVKKYSPRAIFDSTLSQGACAYAWETELNGNVYKYLARGNYPVEGTKITFAKSDNGYNFDGIIRNNLLIEYMYENLSCLSDTYSLWRDGVNLIDIGRYAVALNFYYSITGADFNNINSRIEYVPNFEIKEHLDEIYECIAHSNKESMPNTTIIKYRMPGRTEEILSPQLYFKGSTVNLRYNVAWEASNFGGAHFNWTTIGNDAAATVKMKLKLENSEYILYWMKNDTDVSEIKQKIDQLPEQITSDTYSAVTDIYNSVYSDLSAVQYNNLYLDGYIKRIDDAKLRVDSLKKYNTHFFADFDSNNSELSIVPALTDEELKNNINATVEDMLKNGGRWATTEQTGDSTTDKYFIKNGDITTYYKTFLFPWTEKDYRKELIILDDKPLDTLTHGSTSAPSGIVESTAAATINGKAFTAPYSIDSTDYYYRTDPVAQRRNRIQNPMYKFTSSVLDNKGIYNVSFKFAGTTGHIGDKLFVYTSFTDSKNYEGYCFASNTQLIKIICVNGVVSIDSRNNVNASTNMIKATETINTNSQNDPYLSGTNYFKMYYNGSTYIIEVIVDNNRGMGDNIIKIKSTFVLKENIPMMTNLYFAQNGSKYFDDFEIKTVDIEALNSYVTSLNTSAITKTDIDAINRAYEEYCCVVDGALEDMLDEGIAEKIVIAKTIADALSASGSESVTLIEDIDNIPAILKEENYDKYEQTYNEYKNFCNQGLSTMFTNAQKLKISVVHEIIKIARKKSISSYDSTKILALVMGIDKLSKENVTDSIAFITKLSTYENGFVVIKNEGFGEAVLNSESLLTARSNYNDLKANGKYVDGKDLTFIKTGMQYAAGVSGSWEASAVNGVISLLDLDTSNGIDEIEYTLPVSQNMEHAENLFVYSYSGDPDGDGYADISGIGLFSRDGQNSMGYNYLMHRETPGTDTFNTPVDCIYYARNISNYGKGGYTSRNGDWVKPSMVTNPSWNTFNGNNNIMWYLTDEYNSTVTNNGLVETDLYKWMAEQGHKRFKATGNVRIKMQYMGDGNTVKGFNWYKISITGNFRGTNGTDGQDYPNMTVYSRLFTQGRFSTVGVTHANNVEPETVLKDINIKVYDMPLSLTNGASVRIASGTNAGLRFESNVNTNVYNEMKLLKTFGTNVELGILIAPADYLDENTDLTFESMNASNKSYLAIKQSKWKDETSGIYTAAMTNIKPANYTREFAARGYMKITDDTGTIKYYYSDFSIDGNVRSVSAVAASALDDKNATFSPDEIKVLKVFTGRQ